MVKISGGDKFEAALKEIAKKASNAATAEIGFMENATYPDGKNVAMVAAIQEFGAPAKGIPPRPYFRGMINQNSPQWPDEIAAALKSTNYNARNTLSQMGAVIAGELQQSIVDTSDPPLSPITVMLRGMRTQSKYADMPFWERFAEAKKRVAAGESNYGASSKPLVDTGVMFNSVTYRVK